MLGISPRQGLLCRSAADPVPPIVLRREGMGNPIAGQSTRSSVMARCLGQMAAWAPRSGRFAGPGGSSQSADYLPNSDDDRRHSLGACLLSAALSVLVALGTSAPALAKYKDNKVKRLWDYEDTSAWNIVSPVCTAGSNQSPVDLDDTKSLAVDLPVPLGDRISYKPVGGIEAFNANNKTYEVQGNFGTFILPDGEYSAKQFHFHFPAEHVVNGKQYDGEMHIVHFKQSDKAVTGRLVDMAVIGIPFQIVPEPDSGPFAQFAKFVDPSSETRNEQLAFLKSVGLEAPIPPNGKTVTIPGQVNLGIFKNVLEGKFFHYQGSLTTPPCTEKVHWYVTEKAAPVTQKMLDYWTSTLAKNTARPLQKMYRRKAVKGGLDVPGEFLVATPTPTPAPTLAAPTSAPTPDKSDGKALFAASRTACELGSC